MSLTQTHSDGAYDDTRNRILKWVENAPLAAGEATTEKYIHNGGGDGNPTIGYGYNLAAHTADQNEAALKIALGYLVETPLNGLPQEVQDGLGILRDWKDGLYSNAQIIAIAQGTAGTAAQQAGFQSLVMDDGKATLLLDAVLDGLDNNKGNTIISGYEGSLDDYLNGDNPHGIDISIGSAATIGGSNERAALVSLFYNNSELIGPGLPSALRDDQREEAWYQIRYVSNGDKLAGIASRRYYESEVF